MSIWDRLTGKDKSGIDADAIREAVEEKPDRTLEELLAHLNIGISISTLHRALQSLKLTFKKKS